ncbi:MAG: OST3/OST6 family protein [Leptospirales bacterium]|nr:OST3/OST6 family protein [Leptospirales bacterium]
MSTKKITKVSGGDGDASQKSKFVPTAEAKGRATQLRVFAIIVWVLAIAAEVGAILVLIKSPKPIVTSTWVWLIAFIVLDLILVVIGSMLWKKANRLDPASKQDTVKFFLQNQLGVIIAVIAFLPLVILIFTNKDLEGKQKGILGGVAIAALIIAGLLSADFNPPSVEEYTQQTSRIQELTGANSVYWTKSGTKYHINQDCPYINTKRTEEIFNGTVAQARELKNITELCIPCEKKAEKIKALPNKTVEQNE